MARILVKRSEYFEAIVEIDTAGKTPEAIAEEAIQKARTATPWPFMEVDTVHEADVDFEG